MKKLLLTKRDVCFILGVSPATIDRWRFHEDYAHLAFPRAVNIGYKVFWRPEDIEAWAELQLSKEGTP
jgi:predicted DNA-binding transcriptional regulator AlpA